MIPFRIGEKVTGEFFTDRAAEVRRIAGAMRSPTRLLVYGDRRQGKSLAIEVAARRVRRTGGIVTVADVAMAPTYAEIARRLVSGIPWKKRAASDLLHRFQTARLAVELGTDAVGNPVFSLRLDRRTTDPTWGQEELLRVLTVLDGLATQKKPVAVVLDEFQEVMRLDDRADWILRGLMQDCHNLSFICAGSRRRVIDGLLTQERAFHRYFESLFFGPMDPDFLGRWIEERLEGSVVSVIPGLGRAIVDRVGPRTQDCVQVARAVFLVAAALGSTVGPGEVQQVLRSLVLEDADRFLKQWLGLSGTQRAVLQAVASREVQLFSDRVRRRFGLKSSGSVQVAIHALEKKWILVPGTKSHAIDDPFFREWILMKAMPGGIEGG